MCRRVLSYNVGGVAARSQGSQGFDALHRYIKQGKDFCRDFANILQERYVCGGGGVCMCLNVRTYVLSAAASVLLWSCLFYF